MYNYQRDSQIMLTSSEIIAPDLEMKKHRKQMPGLGAYRIPRVVPSSTSSRIQSITVHVNTHLFSDLLPSHPKYHAWTCGDLHHGHSNNRLSNFHFIIKALQELVRDELQHQHIQDGYPKSHHSHRRGMFLPLLLQA